jgi:hypothetical protein
MKCIENNPIRNSLVPRESSNSVRPLLNTLKKELAMRDLISGRSEVWSAELQKPQISSAVHSLSHYLKSGSNNVVTNDQVSFPEIHSLSEMRFMFGAMRTILWEACDGNKSRVTDLVKSYMKQTIPDEAIEVELTKVDPILSDTMIYNDIENTVSPPNDEKRDLNAKLMSGKQITFEEFKLREGKSFQIKYDNIKDTLKVSKERQNQIVRIINEQKANIDSCNEIMRRYREEESLLTELKGVADVFNESARVDSETYKESCEAIEKSKKAYRDAHAELLICKKEIEELQYLKKKALTAVVDAYDSYCST